MAYSLHGTLVAATVRTVDMTTDPDHPANYREVEVINVSGTAPIYFTVDNDPADPDGTPVVVAGQDTDVVIGAGGRLRVPSRASGSTIVRMISSGTPTYCVRGLG
jgi:hypothetical protein